MVTLDSPDPDDKRTSKEKFLALPVDAPTYCSAVDIVSGMWAYCKLCDKRIPVKGQRAFTIGAWNTHLKEVATTHKSKIAANQDSRLVELRRRETEGTITEREMSRLKQDRKAQKPMTSFFVTNTKRDAGGLVDELETGSTTQCKKNRTSSTTVITTPSVREDKPCQGIIQDFAGSIQQKVAAYCTYAAMDSEYAAGLVQQKSQIFSKLCTGVGIKLTPKNYSNKECQQLWQCRECVQLK